MGKNLHDHVLSFVIHEASREISKPKANILEAHLFAKSDPRLTVPDHQPLFMSLQCAAITNAKNTAELIRQNCAGDHSASVARRARTQSPMTRRRQFISTRSIFNGVQTSGLSFIRSRSQLRWSKDYPFSKWRKRAVWPNQNTRAERERGWVRQNIQKPLTIRLELAKWV